MLPVVLIEVGPQGVQPAYGAALVTACSRAVARGRCVLTESELNLRPDAIAIVSWRGKDQLDVQIQVGTRTGGRTQWVSRRMRFRPADAPVERWRAVGLTVATLVGRELPAARARVRAPAARARVRAPAARVPAPTPPAVRQPAARRWLSVDAAAIAGPGLDSGAWRVGGLLGADLALPALPAFVGVSFDYSVRGRDAEGLSVDFLTASAEGGALWRPANLPVEIEAAGGVELQRIHASVEQAGEADSGSRWVPGLRGRLLALYPVGHRFAALAGVLGWVQTNPTDLRVHDIAVERVPSAGFCFQLGMRARWP